MSIKLQTLLDEIQEQRGVGKGAHHLTSISTLALFLSYLHFGAPGGAATPALAPDATRESLHAGVVGSARGLPSL